MKNFNDIQPLLDRYWEGETTLEEERTLKAYFASDAVDERLRAFAPLFRAIREEQQVQMERPAQTAPIRPQQYNWTRLAAAASVVGLLLIGAWWMHRSNGVAQDVVGQQPIRDVPMQTAPIDTPQILDKQAVSANTAIVNKSPKKGNPSKRPHITKPDAETEMAMAEIKAALALVSMKISKGKQEATKGMIHMDNVDKFIKRKES